MYATRSRLRALLKSLIAERSDSDLLYIPHGEAGIRRMIAALLDMRPPMDAGDPLAGDIAWFRQEFPE